MNDLYAIRNLEYYTTSKNKEEKIKTMIRKINDFKMNSIECRVTSIRQYTGYLYITICLKQKISDDRYYQLELRFIVYNKNKKVFLRGTYIEQEKIYKEIGLGFYNYSLTKSNEIISLPCEFLNYTSIISKIIKNYL
ncbi:hypothetical protein [Fusobacterium necrophorum]|jgi:hypothetical protein|uniref:hypothetical protein n=1 Tax=Fusobacterium necrophorum TaxID=859 RepID=UPI00241ED46F